MHKVKYKMPYIHFVVQPHDSAYPYEAVCKKIFGDNKCLAIIEKKNGEHTHVQGYVTDEYYESLQNSRKRRKITSTLNGLHPKRNYDPNCSPIRIRSIEADDIGFQYMAKELDTSIIVFKQGFEEGELEQLKGQSDEYREELKAKLGEYISERVHYERGETPRQLHRCVSNCASRYYADQSKMEPPNIRLLIRYWMRKLFGKFEEVDWYLSDLNL